MRRALALMALFVASLLMPAATLATPPIGNCPHTDAGFFPGWQPVNRQVWWQRTIAGSILEGIPVYADGPYFNGDDLPTGTFTPEYEQFAVDYGFASAADLVYYVWVTEWAGIDKNADGIVCMKDRPHTPGNPAYFFNGVDNSMH